MGSMGRLTRLGPMPLPLLLATMMRLPSGEVATKEGYQPVGRKPSGLLFPRSSTSITATELLSALATYSVLPSGDSARDTGVLPAGAFGPNAVLITSRRWPVLRSNEITLFVWPQDTKRRLSAVSTMSLGWGSVASVEVTFGCPESLTSTIATVASPRLATNSDLPSFESFADRG